MNKQTHTQPAVTDGSEKQIIKIFRLGGRGASRARYCKRRDQILTRARRSKVGSLPYLFAGAVQSLDLDLNFWQQLSTAPWEVVLFFFSSFPRFLYTVYYLFYNCDICASPLCSAPHKGKEAWQPWRNLPRHTVPQAVTLSQLALKTARKGPATCQASPKVTHQQRLIKRLIGF